jgi:DNA repair protein RecO (recombination protein O)
VVGLAPALDVCAGCGTDRDVTRFAFAAGGTLCERCRTPGAVVLREGLTDYLARLAEADLSDLPPADPALSGDAMGVTRRFLEYHLDRQLASLTVVE